MKAEELAKYGAMSGGGWSWALVESLGTTTPRSGKWMLWPESEAALAVWKIICTLTRSHELGMQAKISLKESESSGERVICIYTPDSDDLPDLQRVVNKLRESLDPKYRLIYKENRTTRAGYYSERHAGSRKDKKNYVERPVSKWYVRPYEKTVNAVKGYTPPQEGEAENE